MLDLKCIHGLKWGFAMKVVREPGAEDDLACWAQPLILDQLSDVYYRAHPNNHLRAATLVALHARAWRALIRGEPALGSCFRQDLMKEVQRAHLSREDVVQADKAVLEELYTVVRQRFRASRHLSIAYLRPLQEAMYHLRSEKLAA